MPPLHLRQEFPSLKAFKDALHIWAIEAHFEPRILKSDTGRVRVGCKRNKQCPFVIRCNWERKGGREPLARVTVFRDRHTCLDGVEWVSAAAAAGDGLPLGSNGSANPNNGNGNGNGNGIPPPVEIRHDDQGRVLAADGLAPAVVPVLPKVHRNSASRLPFLVDYLPRLMDITKDTTPMEIRDLMMKSCGAEVHLQQCRRAKSEILKKNGEREGDSQVMRTQIDNLGGHTSDGQNDASQQLFADMNSSTHASPNPYTIHPPQGVVMPPPPPERPSGALMPVNEAPVRCPYCINVRLMRNIKDAVEHMSMHVVV
ncbi:hypothetical protein B7494_g4542 [Chlorociboria aeruginascens]|nr:hypothetical protein B7494_g4542 [Chlorociboria aeruginascens]